MVAVNLKSLIGRLTETGRRQIEAAAGLTLSRSHYNVEIEHVLLKLIESPGSDVAVILRKEGIDLGRVTAELNRSLDKLRTGNARAPSLSPDIVTWLREAWMIASLEGGQSTIRSGHMLAALLADETLSRDARESCPIAGRHFRREPASEPFGPHRRRARKTSRSRRVRHPLPLAPRRAMRRVAAAPLDQFTINLTEQARAGKIDPVIGRDAEVRQMVDILIRRRQNNPILTGEAGVGKTAVVEGLALRIAAGRRARRRSRTSTLRTLDLGLLQAGAGVKGEFENRLKQVIAEVKASPMPIILFIDEAHTMIGAGGQAGQGDAANLLKPALARGELRTIAATTWAEYKKYFEKDAALARRFQVVKVEEPTEDARRRDDARPDRDAREAPRGAHPRRGGRRRRQALAPLHPRPAAARQVGQPARHRLRPRGDRPERHPAAGRGLPPPDRRCSRSRSASSSARRRPGAGPRERIDERWRRTERRRPQAELDGAGGRAGTGENGARRRRSSDAAASERSARRRARQRRRGCPSRRCQAELDAKTDRAAHAPGRDAARCRSASTRQTIAEVVAGWTGIPVGKMLADEIQTVLNLQAKLERAGHRPGARPRGDQPARSGPAGRT